MKVIILGGKARHGKTTTALFMKEYLESKNIKAITTSIAKYFKMYAKDIVGYNELTDEKPRSLLQSLGREIRQIDNFFLLKRFSEDYLVYKNHADYCIIDDIRLPEEIDYLKEKHNAYSIKIIRTNFDDGLTNEQKNDPTEIGLDNYDNFNAVIENSEGLDELKEKVIKLVEEIL